MRRRAAPSAKGPRALLDGNNNVLWDSMVELFMGARLFFSCSSVPHPRAPDPFVVVLAFERELVMTILHGVREMSLSSRAVYAGK